MFPPHSSRQLRAVMWRRTHPPTLLSSAKLMLQESGGDCVLPTFVATAQWSNVAENAPPPHSCVLHKVKCQISPTLVLSDHLIGAPYTNGIDIASGGELARPAAGGRVWLRMRSSSA
jgi:hypothetical protein